MNVEELKTARASVPRYMGIPLVADDEEWLANHPKHLLGEVLEALLKDHSHHYPVFQVPKDEATRKKIVEARGKEAIDMMLDTDLWVKERSRFRECKTCPDVAGWPCPTRARIAEMLGVDPE